MNLQKLEALLMYVVANQNELAKTVSQHRHYKDGQVMTLEALGNFNALDPKVVSDVLSDEAETENEQPEGDL